MGPVSKINYITGKGKDYKNTQNKMSHNPNDSLYISSISF